MTTKVEKTKSGKGFRITVVESAAERSERQSRRLREFKQDASRVELTKGQARVLKAKKPKRAASA